jgi:hypothetical protein
MQHFDVAIIGLVWASGSRAGAAVSGQRSCWNQTKKQCEYWKKTRRLRMRLLGKVIKNRCLKTPWIRSLIMKSGIGHIPVQQESQAG